MAAVSVGRGANPTQSAYRGRALSRVDLPRTKEEQMELLDDIKYAKKATKRLGKALRRLRRHNWDKGKGQPGWCTVETTTAENEFRTMSAGEEFVGLIENVGPAQSEVEVVMPWMRDFRSTGGLECTASNDSRRIAFTFPPAVYQEEDGHMMRFLDELAAELAPSEMDRLVDPQGKMITGAKQMAGSFRRRQDSRDAVSKSSYRVRDVDPRVGVAEGPVNRILDAVSAITHGSSPAAFAAAGVNRATGVVTRDQAIEVINSDDAEEEQRLRELGAVDDETEDTAEEQEAAGYSRNCEYMVPLTGETFTFWNAEWKASKMGPTYLEKLFHNGLSLMCFSQWCCVFVTFADKAALEAKTGSVRLDIITRRDAVQMRHGYRTARSVVYWLFRNTGVESCNLDTQNRGGRLWWMLAGVVCIVNRMSRGHGTFTLIPLATGYDDSWGPDSDDEELEVELEVELEFESVGDEPQFNKSSWTDDSIHKHKNMPPLKERMRHVHVNGAVLEESDDQYFVDALARASAHAQKKTGLPPSFAAETTTVQNLEAHRRTQAAITAHAILSGHESRSGMVRKISQMSEMNALMVDVGGHAVRLHPTDREVAAQMETLLDQSVGRSVRTLQGVTGEGADVPLGEAISFALEEVGRLIHPPTSTRHVILRFASDYFKLLQLPVPGQQPPPLARTDGWSDDYVLAGAPSPIDAYSPRAAASNLSNALGALLSLPVVFAGGLHRTCIIGAEIMPNEDPDTVDVFVCTTKNCAAAVTRAAATISMTRPSAPPAPPRIAAVEVPLLRVWFMADAGARTDRSLVGGQTIAIFKFADLVGLIESLTYNAYPVIAYTGPDDGPTMRSYYQKLEHEKRQQRCRPVMVNGKVYGFEDGWGADGKGRRDQMGGVNAAGGGKAKWCNECCTVCSATLRNNFPSCHVCTPRVVEDVLAAGGTVTLGMETGGLLRYHFGRCGEVAKALRKERELARILPFLQEHKAADNEWDAPVHIGQSFGQVDNECTSPVFTPVDKANAIIKWLDSGVYKHGPIQKVRKRLKTLLDEGGSKAAFVVAAEKQILQVEQLLRNEGKTHKRDVLPGLEALLKELVDNLQLVENYRKQTEMEMGNGFDKAVEAFLTPKNGPSLGVKKGETIVTPHTTLEMIPHVRALAQSILLQVLDAKQRTGLEQPVLSAATDAKLAELIGFKYGVNADEYTGETDGLYLMAGGALTKDHCRDASQGLKSLCLYDKMPTLGILHIFTIRGWGTLFSAIGMLAWVTGTAKSLCSQLRKRGLNVHYFKSTFSTETLQFGGIKAKGYDSVKIMMNPSVYFGALPPTYRVAVNDIVQLWCAIWLTVGCSLLGHTGCTLYRSHTSEPKAVIRARAVGRVRSMAALLAQLLHGTFGPCVWTPTLHSLCFDVPGAFADADLYPGREDSIEGCQQLARTILKKCVGAGDRNSETLRRWYGLLSARRSVVPAHKFIVKALRRQLIQWNTTRAQALKRAEAVVLRYAKLNGGEEVGGPPLNSGVCVLSPDVDMRRRELYDPKDTAREKWVKVDDTEEPQQPQPGQWQPKWVCYQWDAADDADGEDSRPPGAWTTACFDQIFGPPSLSDKLKGHDEALYGGVQVQTDAADGNTDQAAAAAEKAAAAKKAAAKPKNQRRKRGGGQQRRRSVGRKGGRQRLSKNAASEASGTRQEGPPVDKRQRLDANGAAASAPSGPQPDGEPESADDAPKLDDDEPRPGRVHPRETDDQNRRREAADETAQSMFDLGIEDKDICDDAEWSESCAAGMAEGADELVRGVTGNDAGSDHEDSDSCHGEDEEDKAYSYDDGWNEGEGGHGRVASVESATGGESDPRVYDAAVHGVQLLEESDFGILAYRQLGLVPGPPAQQMQRPKNPAREYSQFESVEFAVKAHSGEWYYYEGLVQDAEVGFGKNSRSVYPMQVQVNIRPHDGTDVQNVKYDLVRPLRGRRGKALNKYNNPFTSEEETYKAAFGGLKRSVGGEVGWGVRCKRTHETAGQVSILPMAPVDQLHEAWARVGGDDSDLVHVVKVDDVLLGMELPAPVVMMHRRVNQNRPTYKIPLEQQLGASTELVKLLAGKRGEIAPRKSAASSSARPTPSPAPSPEVSDPMGAGDDDDEGEDDGEVEEQARVMSRREVEEQASDEQEKLSARLQRAVSKFNEVITRLRKSRDNKRFKVTSSAVFTALKKAVAAKKQCCFTLEPSNAFHAELMLQVTGVLQMTVRGNLKELLDDPATEGQLYEEIEQRMEKLQRERKKKKKRRLVGSLGGPGSDTESDSEDGMTLAELRQAGM